MSHSKQADYVIAGAGVYGSAVAWHLAKRGADVVLLDAREVATQASGGPGRRGVRANGRDMRELPLMRDAYARWPTLHEALGAAPFYERVGQLLVAETEQDVCTAEAQLWLQRHHNIATDWLSKEALLEREPRLTSNVRGALLCPLDGVAKHADVTRAYADAAARLGVDVRTNTRVTDIATAHGRANAVMTSDEEWLGARKGVFVLTNSHVASLLAPWVSLPVWNACLQVLVSTRLDHVPFAHLIGHLSRTISLKPEAIDQIMLSGGWPGQWNLAEEVGAVLPASLQGNVDEAVALIPALRDLQIAEADASHQESIAIDRIPIIDTVPGVDGLWFACGWSGHGWAIAPTVAELLADWAGTDEQPELLRPFALSRFD